MPTAPTGTPATPTDPADGPAIPTRRLTAAGVDTFLYDTGAEGAGISDHAAGARAAASGVPVICVHGNPDSADTWLPLIARHGELGRVVAPDLPGFGRSARPDPAVFDASMDAYVRWFQAFVDELGVDRYRLVCHDWGGLAIAAAALRPEQLDRLVAIDVVPLNADWHWHWIATFLWRPRVVGELGMRILTRPVIKLLTRLQRPGFRPLDAELLDRIDRDLDPGMKRSILALYRSADPEVLGRHGARLGDITAPSLVIWGTQDPYVGIHEMQVLADQLGGTSTTRTVEGGHWPMLDTDEVFDATVAFLA